MPGKMTKAMLAALGLAACTGEPPLAPTRSELPEASLSVSGSSSMMAAGIEDALDRLLPGIDGRLRHAARPLLEAMAQAVAAGDSAQIDRSQQLWRAFERTVPAVVAADEDFAAIRHAVRTAVNR